MLFHLRPPSIAIGSLTLAWASSFIAVDAGSSGARAPLSDRPPTIEVRARPGQAAPPAYAIHDIGMPPANTFPSSSPVAFNNTGEIFGVALRAAKSDRLSYFSDTDCLVWTGLKFVDVEPSLAVQTCTPYAINGANASGAYTVVGASTDIHHLVFQYYSPNRFNDAFTATFASGGTFTSVPFYLYSPAALYGINAAGTAVGNSYNPIQSEALFVTTPGETLSFLQPTCATSASGCLSAVEFLLKRSDGQPTGQCAFGGCTINASGTVIGVDP